MADSPVEVAFEVFGSTQLEQQRVEQEVIDWESRLQFALNVPERITVDASADSVLLNEDPARDLLLLLKVLRVSRSQWRLAKFAYLYNERLLVYGCLMITSRSLFSSVRSPFSSHGTIQQVFPQHCHR